MNDFYETLGVDPSASAEKIKANYRKLSKQYHPDLNQGNKAAEMKFKEISEAYSILGNVELRKEYDQKQGSFAAKKQKQGKEESQGQKAKTSSGKMDLGDMRMQFEQYFGFDPKSKERSPHFANQKPNDNKNPLDTSHIFEGFFKPKKK